MQLGLHWITLVDGDGTHDEHQDDVKLPSPKQEELDNGLWVEKSFERGKDSNIKYSEREYKINKTQKKTSINAKLRHQNWKKFGPKDHEILKLPKGTPEEGVSHKRPQEYQILWHGINLKGKTVGKEPKKSPTQFGKSSTNKHKNTKKGLNYEPPGLRDRNKMGRGGLSLPEPEKYELKILNLPSSCEWGDIKDLIDSFYWNYLKIRPPRKYKIKVIKTYTQEKIGFVEFNSKKYRNLAVKKLNGLKYHFHILDVRESVPRKQNYQKR